MHMIFLFSFYFPLILLEILLPEGKTYTFCFFCFSHRTQDFSETIIWSVFAVDTVLNSRDSINAELAKENYVQSEVSMRFEIH